MPLKTKDFFAIYPERRIIVCLTLNLNCASVGSIPFLSVFYPFLFPPSSFDFLSTLYPPSPPALDIATIEGVIHI